MDEKDSIIGSIPTDLKEKGSILYASLIDGKGGLQTLIKYIKEQGPDKVSVGFAGYCCRTEVATVEGKERERFGGERRKDVAIR
ncbi:hypothetical protein QYF36_008033 [Acer negundo]|nr:hypothetical protein QYF36_008033 [Acer negundo]